jgi:hypothetical protein
VIYYIPGVDIAENNEEAEHMDKDKDKDKDTKRRKSNVQ